MGKNKLRKFAEMDTFTCVYQYPPSVLVREGCPFKGQWNDKVFGREVPLVLELGCGKGEYAVGLALEEPGRNYIGIDIKGARMWTGAKKVNEQGIKNCVFLRTDISQLAHVFAPQEVSEIWITFPDPQMKKERKRLTGTRFLTLYREILKPEAVVKLKTDSPFLFHYTRALLEANEIEPAACTDDLYGEGRALQVPEIRTFYEQQWLARGMKIKYLAFRIPLGKDLVEPEVEIEPDDYRSYPRGMA